MAVRHSGQHAAHTRDAAPKQGGASRVVFRVAAVVLVVCIILLVLIGLQYWLQSKAYDELETYTNAGDSEAIALADLQVDWDELKAINPDVVGWIYVPDTPINYPIVQGKDNEEYLHKSFEGQTGALASAGTIFLDSSNDSTFADQNSAIYGHHMHDGSMFASMAGWDDNNEFNAHRTIYILTPAGNYRLTTIAYVRTVGSDAIVRTQFQNMVDFVSYVQDKMDRSLTTQEGMVIEGYSVRKTMLFSTCEYTNNDGRAVVFAQVSETTVPNDKYLDETSTGTTNLTQDEANMLQNAA